MSATDIFKLRRARHAKWVENYLIEQRLKPLEPPEIAVMRKDREVPWQISRLEFKHPFVLCVLQIFLSLDLGTCSQDLFFHMFCIESKEMGIRNGLTDGELKWLGWVEADALLNGLNTVITDHMGYLMLSNLNDCATCCISGDQTFFLAFEVFRLLS